MANLCRGALHRDGDVRPERPRRTRSHAWAALARRPHAAPPHAVCARGFAEPRCARRVLNGRAIQNRPPHEINRMGLSRSFQITSLFARLTVFENLCSALLWPLGYRYSFWHLLAGQPRLNGIAEQWLDRLALTERRDVPAGALSYAEQRALEIGIAIAGGAQVILLDEPTAGMD
ncbi:MAG: ATP-binding cassette domain-containing protein, partial [Acetobacteraceae bacterium]|nr:ATP-binding cassette domain-containing protein [Acetobacteraceae bacterium]